MSRRLKYVSVDNIVDAISASGDMIKDVAINDVAPIVEEILVRHIYRDIYGAYTPREYKRRYMMSDGDALVVKMLDDSTLFVTINAKPDGTWTGSSSWTPRYDGSFLEMLEKGDLGWWKKGFPRPAVSNAQKEVDENRDKINAAIARGLNRVIGS